MEEFELNRGIYNRKEFETYLGKNVFVQLYDGDVIEGKLCKSGTTEFKDDYNLYLPHNYYFVIQENSSVSCLFRVSHVKKIMLIHKNKDDFKIEEAGECVDLFYKNIFIRCFNAHFEYYKNLLDAERYIDEHTKKMTKEEYIKT